MPRGKQDCCFLDTSILISNFFRKFTDKIEKFLSVKAKYNIPCYISSSVEAECKEKIGKVLNFLGDNILLLRMRLAGEKTRIQHEIILTEQDILLIELLVGDLFKELSEKAKSEGREPPEVEQTLLRTLEDSLVDFLEQRFKENASISIDELEAFLAKCLDDFLYIKEAFDIQQKSLVQKLEISPDSKVVDEICRLGIHRKDSIHIVSAMQYAFSNNLSPVFISVDYKDIVNFQEQLYLLFKFQVCDPLYAYHHLKKEETFKELVDSRSRRRQYSLVDWSSKKAATK